MASRLLDDTTDSAHMLNSKPGKIATATVEKYICLCTENVRVPSKYNDVMLPRAECYYIMLSPSPSHPSTADEASYWPKHVLHSG